MLKNIFYLFFIFLPIAAFSDVCVEYKLHPKITIKNPEYSKTVMQSHIQMDKLHGNVMATMVEDYDLGVDIIPVQNGYCVVLKDVYATIGYNDFMVKIDRSHIIGTCSYDAILHHEDKHIGAYLSVIEDLKYDIRDSVFNASDSIMPVFVQKNDNIDIVLEDMNEKMQKHPDLILIKQKINAAQEIRNKRVDQGETGAELKSCF